MVPDVAKRRILDPCSESFDGTCMKTICSTNVIVTAPQLRRVVDALWALAENPGDRRAKIAVALLEKQRALDCPHCGCAFDVAAYRGTRTAYADRDALVCHGCRTAFVVDDRQTA